MIYDFCDKNITLVPRTKWPNINHGDFLVVKKLANDRFLVTLADAGRRKQVSIRAIAAVVVSLAGLGIGQAGTAGTMADVNEARIINADRDPGNWTTYGRTYSEQRFSPLSQIMAGNATQLGLAWYADLDTDHGQEATPLVIDGVMYVSTAWSLVKAYDAATGKLLWSYDPAVPRDYLVKGCCDAVNRGVAAWKGKIYVGTLDGRLVALDAATGKLAWSVVTGDQSKAFTLTQAPRIVKGRVIIGSSGAEYGLRGYISAYDTDTGKLVWRFYTVPGDPAKPFENEAMAMAAKTWHGEWWKLGGGGSVWQSISYDPELNLIYFGVGNGVEWNQGYRSAGAGDNLFLSSIVAINADTGAYVWHYQTTPGEEWDYDSVQDLILADLTIDGKRRQVLMQANKNGFFYVLDRKTGQFISARNFTPVTWARGINQKTGRPIENPDIRYDKTGKPAHMLPGALGGHSWQSMAFNPRTGLVYIPAQEIPMEYANVKNYKPSAMGWNLGAATQNATGVKGYLLAWDPVKQKEVWREEYIGPWNGGVLTTAGNIVAQGSAAGDFIVYQADTGKKLWSMPTQSAVLAAPVTYEVNGEQYIAVMVGWGGAYPLLEGSQSGASGNTRNISRVLAFKLGGKTKLPPVRDTTKLVLNPPPDTADAETVASGERLFDQYCSVCHGEGAVSGGVVPDLRASSYLADETFYDVLLHGGLKGAGMASFATVLDREQATAIRKYLIYKSNKDKAASNK
ncbi:MAG TPA: PQQ-dependent dehydrogenase, methanol/ethanol family [Burkholderiales bacterium]|nr:PQQ-dependent dehydrogenase, methanol/ethanol family [Burkholderiales bacterium]